MSSFWKLLIVFTYMKQIPYKLIVAQLVQFIVFSGTPNFVFFLWHNDPTRA